MSLSGSNPVSSSTFSTYAFTERKNAFQTHANLTDHLNDHVTISKAAIDALTADRATEVPASQSTNSPSPLADKQSLPDPKYPIALLTALASAELSGSEADVAAGTSIDKVIVAHDMTSDSSAKFAATFAVSIDMAAMKISKVGGENTAVYVATGAKVTSESTALFSEQSNRVANGRSDIYKAAVSARKTSQQLVADMIDFMNGQSSDYLRMIDWNSSGLSRIQT